MNINNLLNQIIRFTLAFLFLYTAYSKIHHFEEFEVQMHNSTLIGKKFIPSLQYLLPFLDAMVFLVLILGKKTIKGFYFSLLVLVIYTVYLVALNNFSFYEGCSCGGIFYALTYTEHLIVNLLFIAINIVGIFIYKEK